VTGELSDSETMSKPGTVIVGIQPAGAAHTAVWRALASIAPMAVFAVLIAVGAQVRIPLPGTDVPMTLQSMAVLLAGYALSPKGAVGATAAYLACGCAGLPVFAPGSLGLAGPTGGYLIGFVAASWLIARLRGKRDARIGRLVAVGLLGTIVILTAGVVWRVPWMGGSWRAAAATGVAPFALKALLQLTVTVALVVAVRGATGNFGSSRTEAARGVRPRD